MPTTATTTTTDRRNFQSTGKPIPTVQNKRKRINRRRGRAPHGIESDDDEMEREAGTDSDLDDNSSVPSDSESDSASDDDHPTNSFEVVTPSTTQSPPPLHVKEASRSSINAPLLNGGPGPFVGATDWAQMVAEETANGDLPVIDFAELNSHSITQRLPSGAPRTQRQKRHAKKAAAATKSAPAPAPPLAPPPRVDDDERPEPVPSTSRPSSQARDRRPPTHPRGNASTRQAYQQRLETDPSYVPTVGEFWGHDERLLDKDLRSLSGWWRGRWQSRGRGRGGMRGRGGRGGFSSRVPSHEDQVPADSEADSAAPTEVPPIERAWTHDGFEEMKRKEERRRAQAEQQQQQARASPSQRGLPFRGRGGFSSARGRGGFARGGHPNSSSSPRPNPPPGQHSGRVWYAMPPEKPWTKHHEYSLYYDNSLKPRSGHGPGIRVKLPGHTSQVVRAPPKSNAAAIDPTSDQAPNVRAASTVAHSEDGDRAFTVRIPGRDKNPVTPPAVSAHPLAIDASAPAETLAEKELSIEEVFTVRPNDAPVHIPIVASEPPASTSPLLDPQADQTRDLAPLVSPVEPLSHLPEPHAQQQLENILITESSDSVISAQIEETVMRKPSTSSIHAPVPQGPPSGAYRPPPPALHPIQTSFTPVPQPSPPYGSPYAYGPMPPGVAVSHHGIPYEVATGRAVYLQPNPAPMYNPRPMMHMGHHHHSGSIPFMPGHMHHPSLASASPDFTHSHPHTPPMNGFIDPATGIPIFTPARQNTRIEIRAPGDRAEIKLGAKATPGPSSLRTTVSGSDTSSQSTGDTASSYHTQSSESNTSQEVPSGLQETSLPADDYYHSHPMAYPTYQQYYYPEHYGYQPYMDPHIPSQVVPYEMYPQDPHAPHQPIIYY